MSLAVASPVSEQPSGLFARAQAGDRSALEVLWREHRRWVAVVLLAHKPSEMDLEDLLQDVAMTMIARIQDVRDPACFKGWLRMVALNAARAAGRHASTRRTLRLDGPPTASSAHEPPARHDIDPARTRQDEASRLMSLATDLPSEYREPLLLRSLHELSYRQIAQMLDLPETTIETRITRARRMLRELAETGSYTVAGAPRR